MYQPQYTTIVKPSTEFIMSSDRIIALQPLADGTPVEGIIGEGRPIGINANWRDYRVGLTFEQGEPPLIDIGKSGWFLDDTRYIAVALWPQRRDYYTRRPTQLMTPLLTFNIIEQLIERARAWQPHLFTV